MGGRHSVAGLLAGLIGIATVWGSTAAQVEVTGAWRTRVSAKLLSVYDSSSAARSAPTGAAQGTQAGRIQADVQYDCSTDAPTQALTAAGLEVNSAVRIAPFCVIEGWVAPGSLPGIATVAGVQRVTLPSYAVHPHLKAVAAMPNASPAATIDRNGVKIMRADQFVAQTGAGGAGAKVGVQSGGISNISKIQARGELPAVQVVQPSDGTTSPPGDEGTALLEEVHAVAPGAALAYCGPSTYVEYTSCLGRLIAAGANILVDDIIFAEEDLLSADSPQVQAVEQLLAQNPGVTLFTAAGNYNGSYWQGDYSPVSLSSAGLPPLTCPSTTGTQTDYYVAQFDGDPSQILTVMQSSSVPVALAWADPPNQNASKFDVYWIDNTNSTVRGCLAAAAATDNQINKTVGLALGSYTLYIGTPDASAAGKFLKLWIGGDGLTSISKPTAGSVVTPQAYASGSVSVGAVNGSDGVGNNIESFSSIGPATLIFPDVRQVQVPILVAPDGINVDAAGTYFAGSLFPDGNFYGTSASAPNAAGVAALIRGAFPRLSSSQLVDALKAGATQLGSAPPDGTFGYGRIDAMGALGTFPVPTITPLPAQASMTAGTASPSYTFTVSGTGGLRFSVTSSNASAIPPSVVAAGSPGVTITPSDCGVTTLTCSVSVMPANGPGGAVDLTIAAVDGANRSAASTIKVSVTGNQAAPTNSTPGPTPGSGGGGGALDLWAAVALLLLAGRKVRRRAFAHLHKITAVLFTQYKLFGKVPLHEAFRDAVYSDTRGARALTPLGYCVAKPS
jgi:Subtilase family